MELALENARAHELAQAQATTDELTGLANRRAFNSSLDHRPGRLSFAILVIDIDGLKRVNDTKGHHAGDELLSLVARLLAATLRSGDVLARLGGDEFAALLFDADEIGGRDVAKRMLQLLGSAPCSHGTPSVSIGVACGPHDANGSQVLAAADAAMYRAKRLGGGCFVVDGDVEARLSALA
jgi:diguanylate cyclase (GGDEF)-like protein